MPTLLAPPLVRPAPARPTPTAPDAASPRPGRRRLDQRHQRRRLRRDASRADRLSRRRAELAGIAELLASAADVVAAGWVQGRWSAPAAGPTLVATDAGLRTDGTDPVLDGTGGSGGSAGGGAVCLLGGLVRAAGGRAHVLDQRVQRSVDLLWETLHRPEPLAVTATSRLLAVPAHLRQLEVWDLTRWNDTPGRTRAEVVELLRAASSRARLELALQPTG